MFVSAFYALLMSVIAGSWSYGRDRQTEGSIRILYSLVRWQEDMMKLTVVIKIWNDYTFLAIYLFKIQIYAILILYYIFNFDIQI